MRERSATMIRQSQKPMRQIREFRTASCPCINASTPRHVQFMNNLSEKKRKVNHWDCLWEQDYKTRRTFIWKHPLLQLMKTRLVQNTAVSSVIPEKGGVAEFCDGQLIQQPIAEIGNTVLIKIRSTSKILRRVYRTWSRWAKYVTVPNNCVTWLAPHNIL